MMPTIAVVIPSYKVKNHILKVISEIGPEVDRIFVVDDKCPVGSGDYVADNCNDPRVSIIRHEVNQGVGGAVISGYKAAIKENIDIIVKVDGDGQMNPKLIPKFVQPIIEGEADYVKGNRFYDLTNIKRMPLIRIIGNSILSFLTKISTGYWHIFDPTNGYTAIHSIVAEQIPLSKVSRRYFFESDMLFRLNIARASVVDIPMDAVYGDEESNLSVSKVVFEFAGKHIKNFMKRIFYNYFLRDMSLASIELILGLILVGLGVIFGIIYWINSAISDVGTPLGTIMLISLSILIGFQFLLGFLSFDISNIPKRTIFPFLTKQKINNK